MYVDSAYEYLHDFRRAVEHAVSKLKAESKLSGVSNSAQTRHQDCVLYHSITIERTPRHAPPDPQMGS
jgi:hypothetical protein